MDIPSINKYHVIAGVSPILKEHAIVLCRQSLSPTDQWIAVSVLKSNGAATLLDGIQHLPNIYNGRIFLKEYCFFAC
jgi:hypothetical protein